MLNVALLRKPAEEFGKVHRMLPAGKAYGVYLALLPEMWSNGYDFSAFDGIAYGETQPGVFESRDTLIVEAGENEGIYMAPFPMEKIRKNRRSEIHGNAYRHPSKYRMLISEDIAEPFIRKDYRK